MKSASVALLLLLGQEGVCDHGSRGASRPIDLREVARLHGEIMRDFDSLSIPRTPSTPSWGFDSGLPHCRGRRTRAARVEPLPPDLKPLYFAPAGSDPPEDSILVATRARSVTDAPFLAVREVSDRFGVRCVPTWVRPAGPSEVQLLEGR